ncbi:Holliday junction branch migration protein RuvA [Fructilactobacillus sanfranciscensis]|uniref:Holliday junction branch migration complex subunit RuvA n=1 Tax=Fructilactobacillus sanfranciscensis (strain TMW 1.1304) TaxID=714313 RepID=G2KVR3_FRUST|nr:Holliday junction branch migration protein RuvA [Fructilactobacillus sanfranciscensis]AEN99307.1 Holliday junction ATP-dependent DNA helicase ruvA [Fructilactobacillus sanfranciscensis TMW 1.1304]KRM81141.1 Holliday junction ATP-dependent DNA helicase ruvA [Fructilactobacillus sanfranciscensis DSM 20451]MCG7193985.1 Holliday junction branch migration protein RuvA [Fructilactobacillus sanfranciscensis]MCG7195247.1 Holliday junction branch migration protein RuvA [Fructilactobacillus sanfrancis
MYEYLYGELTDISDRYIVIDVNGVGYLVNVANPYHFETDIHTKKKIYVHQSVTDSSMTLYGFETLDDKQLFEQLLNVSGIGSKSALAIMAGNDNTGLINAIKTENVSFLVKFPGIGKKTAQQIILDLKDKIDKNLQLDLNIRESNPIVGQNPKLDDALNALEALGFTHKSVEKIQSKLAALDESTTTDQYISNGLKMLTK